MKHAKKYAVTFVWSN